MNRKNPIGIVLVGMLLAGAAFAGSAKDTWDKKAQGDEIARVILEALSKNSK